MANELARHLRRNLTVDERRLWAELRELRRVGVHFRRQAPIGRYIVDFVCFKKRLVVEVDGIQHDSAHGRKADQERDAFLTVQGFRVLRFTNGDVTHSLDGVVLEVMAALDLIDQPKTPHP